MAGAPQPPVIPQLHIAGGSGGAPNALPPGTSYVTVTSAPGVVTHAQLMQHPGQPQHAILGHHHHPHHQQHHHHPHPITFTPGGHPLLRLPHSPSSRQSQPVVSVSHPLLAMPHRQPAGLPLPQRNHLIRGPVNPRNKDIVVAMQQPLVLDHRVYHHYHLHQSVSMANTGRETRAPAGPAPTAGARGGGGRGVVNGSGPERMVAGGRKDKVQSESKTVHSPANFSSLYPEHA